MTPVIPGDTVFLYTLQTRAREEYTEHREDGVTCVTGLTGSRFRLPPSLPLISFRLPFEMGEDADNALLIVGAEPVDGGSAQWLISQRTPAATHSRVHEAMFKMVVLVSVQAGEIVALSAVPTRLPRNALPVRRRSSRARIRHPATMARPSESGTPLRRIAGRDPVAGYRGRSMPTLTGQKRRLPVSSRS